jgi:septum formation protein
MPQTADKPSRPHPDASPAEVVLASQSPRRRRLLDWLSVPFVSTAVDTPELLDTPLASDPPALATSLAAEKAEAARADGHGATGLVLCFDTIVVLDGDVLGKPVDTADAWRMLRALSGRTHQVVTGVAVLVPGSDMPRTLSVTTDVAMKQLTDCQIEAWMAMGTFLGCAGAYNIEAQVAEVGTCDCYQNVAGLPLCHVYSALTCNEELAAWLPAAPCSPVAACDAALGRTCELGPSVVAGC